MSYIDSSIRYKVRFFGIYSYNYLNPEYTCSNSESNNDEDVTCDREATGLGITEDVWEIMTVLSVTETRIRDVTLHNK
jgi:hypothetical protein